jgi:hypothetical protein
MSRLAKLCRVAGCIPKSPSAEAAPDVALNSVSCASVGNCSAVGQYDDGANGPQGLLLSETAGRWATGVEASTPPGRDGGYGPKIGLDSVSCASVGNCSAIGYYNTSFIFLPSVHGLLLNKTTGMWGTAMLAVAPTGPPEVFLESVSCSSPGNCSAVGYYNFDGSSDNNYGLLLNETAGQWAAGTEATVPASAGSNPVSILSSLSCASAGNCTAVGFYASAPSAGSPDTTHPLLLDETAGTWMTGTASPLPPNAAREIFPGLGSVSCAPGGDCSAVGSYFDSSNDQQGVLVSGAASATPSADEAALPSNAGSNPDVLLGSVSCTSTGNCATAGSYHDSAGNTEGLLLNETSGAWTSGVEVTPPANAGSNPDIDLASLSCASAGDCSGVGSYTDSTGDQQGVLFSEGSAVGNPALSVSAPSSGTAGTAIAASSVSAALSGGASPTGTITFKVFGPQVSPPSSCTSGGRTVGTASVSGNRTYHPSAGYAPSGAGDYWWYTSYAGDTNNRPAVSACGASMAKTIVGSPRPALSRLHITPHTFVLSGRRVNRRCVKQTTRNHRRPRCTRPIQLVVGYQLNIRARVRFTITHVLAGRRIGRRCVRQTGKNRTHRQCNRLLAVPGTITERGRHGNNRFTLNGRIGRRRLATGRYRLTAKPTTNGQSGIARTVPFRILA